MFWDWYCAIATAEALYGKDQTGLAKRSAWFQLQCVKDLSVWPSIEHIVPAVTPTHEKEELRESNA